MMPVEDNRITISQHLTSPKENSRLSGVARVFPLRSTTLPPAPPRKEILLAHVEAPLQLGVGGRLPSQGPYPRPPPSESDSQGPRRDKSAGRAHSPARRRQPGSQGTALGGGAPAAGAQSGPRARSAKGCKPGGAGSRRGASGRAGWDRGARPARELAGQRGANARVCQQQEHGAGGRTRTAGCGSHALICMSFA